MSNVVIRTYCYILSLIGGVGAASYGLPLLVALSVVICVGLFAHAAASDTRHTSVV